ncbi:MAG: HAD hydrolase-like protein [Bryobacteraceae bacterium]|nr:HAD hydrolase-like protein [Bryobacteraceae bacterium]
MELKPVLVFDMDGVLVDVSDSYRATIVEVVRHFTGQTVTREVIQDYKNAGGWNNDWALSQKLIAEVGGQTIAYEDVVKVFQQYFFGLNNDGLVLNEKWIPAPGLLEGLSTQYMLSIFTGRLLAEAQFTLTRFVPQLHWSMIVADDNVARSKPAPDGLLNIASAFPGAKLLYFGDTVDDARSASAAGVEFIGVAHGNNPKHSELVALLRQEGARDVIDNIGRIGEVL